MLVNLSRIIERASSDIGQTIALTDHRNKAFADLYGAAHSWSAASSALEPMPKDFARKSWPAYLRAVKNNGYYFSVDELTAMCSVAQVGVVIFTECEGRLRLQSFSGDYGSPYIFVKLASNARGPVRSHFERLIPLSQVHEFEEQHRRKEASAAERRLL